MVTTEASIEGVLRHCERLWNCRATRDAEVHEGLAQVRHHIERRNASIVALACDAATATNHRDTVALAFECLNVRDAEGAIAAGEALKFWIQRTTLFLDQVS